MSVIITEMDMPKECTDCLLHNNLGDYCRGRLEIASIVRGKNDCPLKSIEGLIDQINLEICSPNYYCSETETAGKIIDIIKEYCEVSDADT